MRCLLTSIAVLLAAGAAAGARAQDSDRPREFAEFRGTWLLDDAAGPEEIRQRADRLGKPVTFDGLGLPLARRLLIDTNATGITLTKDSSLPETYRFDGVETQTKDPRTGAPLAHRYSFTLVAQTLALTSKITRCCDRGGLASTEIITDAYSLAEWNVLRMERQLSYLRPEGFLRDLSGVRNNTQTIFYRRQEAPR
jgi:hypothetical protein